MGSKKPSRKDLETCCNQQKELIAQLRSELKQTDVKERDSRLAYLKKRAEEDKYLSYVVLDKRGRVIASTKTFREKFNFNDPIRPIEGMHFYRALKILEDAPDYIPNIRELLTSSEKIKKQTTIYDGKRNEKIVKFTKYEPWKGEIRCVGIGKEDKCVSEEYFFTRVDVYEIGLVKRKLGEAMRKLHITNGEAEDLASFVSKQIVAKTKSETKKEAEEIMAETNTKDTKKAKKKKKSKNKH